MKNSGQQWGHVPEILAYWKQKQEHHEFAANLRNTGELASKINQRDN